MNLRNAMIGLAGALLLSATAMGQGGVYSGGAFALGMRSTANVFTADEARGLGTGGQFKIGVTKHINTEWFADLIESRIRETGYRRDYHIGWSVQFALGGEGFGEVGKVRPYILGGQCFDLTQIGIREVTESDPIFSAAAQLGAGASFFPIDPLELTFQGQWMAHLTKDAHIEWDGPSGPGIHVEDGINFEGHLLLTLAANFYFADFKK